MTTFHLTVVTPDGCAFDGQAERVVCRAIDGDLAILAKHGDYCTALGMGEAHIVDADGQRRRAACMGGMLTVLNGDVHLVATTWEWAEEIDQARAEASKKRAEEIPPQARPRPHLCPLTPERWTNQRRCGTLVSEKSNQQRLLWSAANRDPPETGVTCLRAF